MKLKVMSVFGTRPEAIKMAPVVRELQRRSDFEVMVAVTAQHREMLDQVLALFQIKPDFDLNIMMAGQTLYDVMSRVLLGLRDVYEQAKPDIVLVHGDTTTTFAGALAAYYQQIDVGHVEAGLRTGNPYSPFPEEMNRRLTGGLARWHFAPTESSKNNLLREGVADEKVFVVGNTVIDALLATVKSEYVFTDPELATVDWTKKIILVTTHRRENLGAPMRHVYNALKRLMETMPGVEIIFPVHRNPLVRCEVEEALGDMEGVNLCAPLDYEAFVNLIAKSTLVLTDSGGIQEEAPSLGKPVLVLRETTERPEAVAVGAVKLVGTNEEEIYAASRELLQNPKEYDAMANAINPYGDGFSALRIADTLLYAYGRSEKKPDIFIANKNLFIAKNK